MTKIIRLPPWFEVNKNTADKYSNGDLGAILGIGYDFDHRFNVALGFNYGLATIGNGTSFIKFTDVILMKNRILQVTVGYISFKN